LQEYLAHKLKLKLANRGIGSNLHVLSLTILVFFLLINWLFPSFIGTLIVTVFFITPIALVIFLIINNSQWAKDSDAKLHENITKTAIPKRLNAYRKAINETKKSLPLKYAYELNDSAIKISVESSKNKREFSYKFKNLKFGYFGDSAAIFTTNRFPQRAFRIDLSDKSFTSSLIEKLKQENIPLYFAKTD
jgi:hypothetical protein